MPENNNSSTNNQDSNNDGISTNNSSASQSDYTVSEGGWVSVNTSTSQNRSNLEIQKGSTDSWLKK